MKNFSYSYQTVKFSQMKVDYSYQRHEDVQRIKEIVDNFSHSRVNPVKVSLRDNGYYYIWDGQHTAKACAIYSNVIKHGDLCKTLYKPDPDASIKCIVYSGMTREDEAYLFACQDRYIRSITAPEKFNALYVAGDQSVIDFKTDVEKLGISCRFKTLGVTRPLTLACFSTCYRLYMQDKTKFLRLLRIIKLSWLDSKDAFRREIISGLNTFMSVYENDYDEDLLISKLSLVTPLSIIRDGKALQQKNMNKCYAMQIATVYNKQLRKRKLDYNKILELVY